jgi:hypothetical protein
MKIGKKVAHPGCQIFEYIALDVELQIVITSGV